MILNLRALTFEFDLNKLKSEIIGFEFLIA